MKTAFIKTYGCQMNEQDSSQMYALLASVGYQKADDFMDADFILINSCSVREKAFQKIYSELGRIGFIKNDKPNLIVGIAGCVAEQKKENLYHRFPFIDLILGPDHIRHLPDMLKQVFESRGHTPKAIVKTGFDLRKDFEFVNVLPSSEDETPIKAFVNIQKGCDNICSFCIVPFVRGREVSRSYQEIIREIKELVDRGVKEVTLLGQNVNSYGLKSSDGVSFSKLLEWISTQTDLKRLRFTTSHPKDVQDDLIDQFVNNPILVPQFHLPVQSGSNRILSMMKRQYTREHYLDIVEKLCKKVPAIRFSTDVIVGFPSETEGEFEETLDLMQRVKFDQIFSFVYSPRPYTKAKDMVDDVSFEEKQGRLLVLQSLDKKIKMERNESEINAVHEILVESKEEEQGLYPYQGRTLSNKIVHFHHKDCQPGDLVSVKIIQANPHSLYGEGI